MRLRGHLLVPLIIVLLGVCSAPQSALAWGKFGHLVVCDLAYRNLTETSREKLKELFNVKHGGITVKGKGKLDDRHYTSFNVGCLEEDALPRRHPEDHFINFSRDTKAIEGSACPTDVECIFDGIERDLATLKDTSASNEDRVFALMAVGHWIGDIHQPLHISFADDRGGNSIDVKLKGKCGHSVLSRHEPARSVGQLPARSGSLRARAPAGRLQEDVEQVHDHVSRSRYASCEYKRCRRNVLCHVRAVGMGGRVVPRYA